jgi:hypothetical protein
VLFMVIERFTPAGASEIYRRLRRGGRGFPEGLRYVDSWVRADLRGCFQLMECEDPASFQEWIAYWATSPTSRSFPWPARQPRRS